MEIDLASDVVVEFVVALIKAVAAGVPAVAHGGVVDLVGSGYLRQQGLDGGVDRRRLQEGDFVRDAAEIVGEDAAAGVGCQNGVVLRRLLVRANGLVAGIEEQLILLNWPADKAAELAINMGRG